MPGGRQKIEQGVSALRKAHAPRSTSRAISVTAASWEDIPELLTVKRAVIKRAYSSLFEERSLDDWIDRQATEGFFNYRIGRKDYHLLVARDQKTNKIVGFAQMRKRGDRADMSNLYVLHPSQGIGQSLVAARSAIAKDQGCVRTRASVFRNNLRAVNFVKAQGLKKIGGGFREKSLDVRVDHYEGSL